MRTSDFLKEVAQLTFENAFNPYSNCCPLYDRDDAPLRRREALRKILVRAIEVEVDSIWIGRDLGYRGGRRTGLAFTDDLHVDAHAARWGIRCERPTKGLPVGERTAATIWRILDQVQQPVFLWNVFPLHPHEPGKPLSNRSHNARERTVGEEVLASLVRIIRPRRLVAVGNDALSAATRVATNQEVIKIRHPSYGGQTEFLSQATSLYHLPATPPAQFDLL